MKLKTLSATIAIAAFAVACSGGANEESQATTTPQEEQEVAAATSETNTYTVNTEASSVTWKGVKTFVVDYGHTGTVAISSGELSVTDGAIEAGNFSIDMSTIAETGNDNEEYAMKLAGHLMSPDFFDVENNPTADFAITGVDGDNISGNLTIKGVSKNISFPATVEITDTELKASADFAINRMDWGVEYGNGSIADIAKDNIIDNNIEFTVALVATK